jgi:hypothetical protein
MAIDRDRPVSMKFASNAGSSATIFFDFRLSSAEKFQLNRMIALTLTLYVHTYIYMKI